MDGLSIQGRSRNRQTYGSHARDFLNACSEAMNSRTPVTIIPATKATEMVPDRYWLAVRMTGTWAMPAANGHHRPKAAWMK